MVLFFAVLGSTVKTCSASVPGCFGRFDLIFYVKGNSGPEVVSCPALRACLRVVLNGEVFTVDTSVVFRAGVAR